MKNWEFNKNKILKITISGEQCAVVNNKVKSCSSINCSDCDFYGCDCSEKFAEWCNKEHIEPEIQEAVKYSKMDDKILVSDDGRNWTVRHFCKYKNEKVYAFAYGTTSKSNTKRVLSYQYAKLPESIKENKYEN